jgi:hypothetical protein
MIREIDLHVIAAWARARAMRPRPGDIASPADLRTFARECSERAKGEAA